MVMPGHGPSTVKQGLSSNLVDDVTYLNHHSQKISIPWAFISLPGLNLSHVPLLLSRLMIHAAILVFQTDFSATAAAALATTVVIRRMEESCAPRRKGRGVVVEVEMDLPFLRRNIPKKTKRRNHARRADEPRHAAKEEDKQPLVRNQHPPPTNSSCEQQPVRTVRPCVALPFLPRSTRPRIRRQAVAAAAALETKEPAIHHSKIPAPGSAAAAVARWWCSHVERRAGGSKAEEDTRDKDDDGHSPPPPPKIMTTTRHPLLMETDDQQCSSVYSCPICHGRFRPYAASSSSVRMMVSGTWWWLVVPRERDPSQSGIQPPVLLRAACL